ncbi:MAG: alanyl-tRNA editing protein [Bacillota bacterium]
MEGKLYYQDPYLVQFSTEVIEQGKDESGKWYAILKETAFYPTGGGQPCDTGYISGVQVYDVEERNGEIFHYLESPLPNDVTIVDCQLDWKRRYDHMQQHSGQHILSAAFENLLGFRTVSFHLGKDTLTIDLDIGELSEKDAMVAEEKANQIVAESRNIETKWVQPNELSQYRLRKQVSVTENIRLVIIPEFDYNGCGGTHPRTTAETGPIKILGWEKQRKKIRVEFICGGRVLAHLQQKHTVIQRLSGLLNAPQGELVHAVERLLDGNKKLEQATEEANDRLVHYEGKEIIENHPEQMVTEVFQNRSIQELQKLARSIISMDEAKIVVLLAENGERLQVVCARGEKDETNMRLLMEKILPYIQGKGGGSERFAQGGGAAVISGEMLIKTLKEKEVLQ